MDKMHFKNPKFTFRPEVCKQCIHASCLQNCSVKTSFGKQMYLKIGLSLKELQRTKDTL